MYGLTISIALILTLVCIQSCTNRSKGTITGRIGECPLLTNNSNSKILSFSVTYTDFLGRVVGSNVKTLKPGETKVLHGCEGSHTTIAGAVEISPQNYEQRLKLDRISGH